MKTIAKYFLVNLFTLGLGAVCLVGFLPGTTVSAQSPVVWDNADMGDFMDAANWDPQQVPGEDNFADISNGGTAVWNSDGAHTVFELRSGWQGGGHTEIQGGGTFTNLGWLWIGGLTGEGNEGTVTVSGEGTVLENVGGGNTNIGRADSGEPVSSGTLTIESGATFSHVADGLIFVGFQSGNQGTINLNGGTFNSTGHFIAADFGGTATVNHNSGAFNANGGQFWIASGGGSEGTYNLSDGEVNVAAGVPTRIGNWGSTGILNLSGGEFNSNYWFALGQDGGGTGILNMSGGTLTRSGEGQHMVLGSFAGNGVINQSGGLIDLQNGNLWISEIGDSTGSVTLSDTGVINTNQGIVHIGVQEGAQGELTIEGGTLQTTRILGGDGSSIVTFDGGQIVANASHPEFIHGLSSAFIAAGGLHIDTNGFDLGISQDMAGTGSVVISGAGSVAFNGTLANVSGVSVEPNATLMGTGMIGAPVSIAAGAFINPGTSIGSLTVASAEIEGTFVVEFDGSEVDFLDVLGELDITNAILELSQIGDNLSGVHVFASYALLTGTEFVDVIGLPDGYHIDYNYLGGNDLAVVPEPSTYAAIFGFLALAGTLMLRRRRRS